MKIHFLSILLLVGLSGTVWARLGETEDQLLARYGGVTSKKFIAANGKSELVPYYDITFSKSGFSIEVILVQGVSAEELIFKTSEDKMTDDEIRCFCRTGSK